jgi:hypothetical protein
LRFFFNLNKNNLNKLKQQQRLNLIRSEFEQEESQ